ncbi:unnamed protein product [Trichobilharzia regenti]|nr:unnamed protein product [Trichobilharzia regenti]
MQAIHNFLSMLYLKIKPYKDLITLVFYVFDFGDLVNGLKFISMIVFQLVEEVINWFLCIQMIQRNFGLLY